MPQIAIFLLFLFSGISGLIYEVVWTRLLTTILGNTTFAVSIVLSAFMAGLSIGSLIAGRYVDARKDAFKLYAFLEICIGIAGFCLTLALDQTGPLYIWIHHVFSVNGVYLSFGRYLFAFVILALPTTVMGATLPVLSKFTVDREPAIGMTVGMLYAVNTLGAAAGCYATGFLFIGSLGILKTVLVAVLINVTIGIVAWFLRDSRIKPVANKQSKKLNESKRQEPTQLSASIVLLAFSISGFAAMGYEITWTRILITYMGNTVYAFSAMLTSFLLGLGLGSLLLSYFVNRFSKLFVCFSALQIGIGLCIMIPLYFFGNHLQFLVPFISPYPVVSNISGMFLKAMVLMLPPTLLMGASFPVATHLYVTNNSTVARKVSVLYSWNTIACIAGSTITGFLLIPYLGFEKSIIIMLFLNIGSGIALFTAEPGLRRSIKTPVVISIVVFFFVGTIFIPHSIIRTLHETIFHKEEKTLYYKETPYGIVEVLQTPSRRRLLQDDLDLAGTSMAYLSSQKPLGHLPMLLHPHPQNVFIIGFGGGGASYAVSTYPDVKHIDIAELNRSIITTAPLFFSVNHDVLSNPKVSLHIDDGRHFLLTTRSHYDIISVDLLWPQSAGAGSLYTKEFYRLCFNRLNEKGVMVEWIHNGLIPQAYLKVILNTVRQVFPYVSLWTSRSFGHLFLVVSKDPHFHIDYQLFSKKIKSPLVAKDLSEISIDKPDVFLSYFIADGVALDNIIGDENTVNTDNLPVIEYKLPFNRKWSWYGNAAGIMSYKKPVHSLIENIDSLESCGIRKNEQTMNLVLQSKINYTSGDQLDAIFLCTDAVRANPANPEATSWYEEFKQTMKCLSDSGKAPPNILSAFDTSDVTNISPNQ